MFFVFKMQFAIKAGRSVSARVFIYSSYLTRTLYAPHAGATRKFQNSFSSLSFHFIWRTSSYYMLAGALVCEQDYHKLAKSSLAANTATPPVRKGKVGRPRRSRD